MSGTPEVSIFSGLLTTSRNPAADEEGNLLDTESHKSQRQPKGTADPPSKTHPSERTASAVKAKGAMAGPPPQPSESPSTLSTAEL